MAREPTELWNSLSHGTSCIYVKSSWFPRFTTETMGEVHDSSSASFDANFRSVTVLGVLCNVPTVLIRWGVCGITYSAWILERSVSSLLNATNRKSQDQQPCCGSMETSVRSTKTYALSCFDYSNMQNLGKPSTTCIRSIVQYSLPFLQDRTSIYCRADSPLQ